MSSEGKHPNRLTVPALGEMKSARRPIVMLTAYDYSSAVLAEAAEVDVILVGDSLGNVVQGRETTLAVTLDEMAYHANMVGRGSQRAMLVVDMPFGTFHIAPEETARHAIDMIKRTPCQAVKMEGGVARADHIRAIVEAGIPVMGHIGLEPQAIHRLGRYAIMRDREQLIADAKAVEQAGAFSIVLECIPSDLAAEITDQLSIPTIGIGAGPQCDGQVLVFHDMLNLNLQTPPRHVRVYADLGRQAADAIRQYGEDVRARRFPGDAESPK